MIRDINHDKTILAKKSVEANQDDEAIGRDLCDTLLANRERCVGMAANMIGELKRIIVFFDEGELVLMYNPVLLKKSGASYKTKEGCLSLLGEQETIRYESVKIEYLNERFEKRIKTYKGFSAQIIQHEMDHLEGILI